MSRCFSQIADIREFEEFADTISDMEKFPLYQSAMRHFEETPIPVRQIRTEMVNCASDLEYLAKLHCIRLAFQYLFRVNLFFIKTNCRRIQNIFF